MRDTLKTQNSQNYSSLDLPNTFQEDKNKDRRKSYRSVIEISVKFP